jgi:hypothetical protein
MNGSSRCTLGAETIVSAPCVGYSKRYPRELCQPLSTDRSRRGAGYFLCVAKKSNQRKATARGRPSASLGLQVISVPCAKLARSRLRRATCSDTRPALPRCRPASPRHPRAANGVATPAPRRFSALEAAEQRRKDRGFGPRLSEARGSAHSAEIVRVSRAAGPSEQHRAPPQAAASWARLSLVTFFAKTKKVTGRAALKHDVDGRGLSSAAARRSSVAHHAIATPC